MEEKLLTRFPLANMASNHNFLFLLSLPYAKGKEKQGRHVWLHH